jgi:ribosomal protein L7Ae-like RNA K-turn-binding protein
MPHDPILHMLGLARKAGKLELGEEPVGALCRARHARLVLLAGNAAPNTYRRAAHFGEAGNVLHISLPHTKEELGFHFGRGSVAIMALADAGLAASLMKKLAAMDPARYAPAAEQLSAKADKMLQRQREKRQHEKNLRMGKVRQAPAPAPKAEAEPAPVPKFKPANKPERSKKFAPHSDAPHAPKPPRPGSSAPHARQDKRDARTAPSFKPGPGGRKLSGKFRKP